jgi:hypothetical protein
MKKLTNLIYLFALGLLLTGCDSNLLNTQPTASVSSATMWTTVELANFGVNGVYAALKLDNLANNYMGFTGSGFYWMEQDALSSEACNNIGGGNFSPLCNGTATPSNYWFSLYWQQNYEGIQRANTAILNLPNSPLAAADKARTIAECKFLRAWFYYNLNQVFQGVPLYLTPVDYTTVTKGCSSMNDVWNQILADLTDCINETNLPNMYAKTSTSFGRVTKAAAYALRGKVYMWMKNYTAAKQDFIAVGTAGATLNTSCTYQALFTVANEQCPEMIFSVQNMPVSGYGSIIQKFLGSRDAFGSDWNNIIPSPNFVESYEESNGAPFSWNDYLSGYNNMTPAQRSVYFLRDTTDVPKSWWSINKYASAYAYIQAKGATYGADMSKYLPVGNEARIAKAYSNRDPRLMMSIVTPYSTFLGANASTAYTYTLRWPFIQNDTDAPFDLRTDQSSKFYYVWRKFVSQGVDLVNEPAREYGALDLPLIRYADVLLLQAEAMNENNEPIAGIVSLINQVRQRAGAVLLQTTDITLPTYVAGQNDLRERIRNERRWELCLEGVDFFDELRWQSWKTKKFYNSDGITANGVKEINGNVVSSYAWIGDFVYRWPVPAVEVQRLGTAIMTPTPGWTY